MNARRSFRRPPNVGKIILQWMEYFFLLLAIIALGYFVWAHADTLVYQAYESWRLDQMQQNKPASVGRFLKEQVPFLREQAPAGVNDNHRLAQGGQPEPIAPEPALPHEPRIVERGALIGRIRIPRLRLSAMVVEGVDSHTLRRAVGHLPGSALPGDSGNVDLAGHRDTFFRGLMNAKHGDLITMSTPSGETYQYRVNSVSILPPDAMPIINSYKAPGLNLITCYPFYYVGPAPERYVVHAEELNVPEENNSDVGELNGAAESRFVSASVDNSDFADDEPSEPRAAAAARRHAARSASHQSVHAHAEQSIVAPRARRQARGRNTISHHSQATTTASAVDSPRRRGGIRRLFAKLFNR